MTLDELKDGLGRIMPGQFATIHYGQFPELFPQCGNHKEAQRACFEFARKHGCFVQDMPEIKEAWLVKDAPRS